MDYKVPILHILPYGFHNHWGWGRVGWRFWRFCFFVGHVGGVETDQMWCLKRSCQKERINRSMFKLHVPESKSKELFHFTSSMTCEDLSFADGKTRAGGYPTLSTWNKISLNQLQVELFFGSGSPSCRISTSWSPWMGTLLSRMDPDPCSNNWMSLHRTDAWSRLGCRWGEPLEAHDWKWNQQQIEGLVWSSPWIPWMDVVLRDDQVTWMSCWVPSSQDKSHIQL